jgi:hypothetical protein
LLETITSKPPFVESPEYDVTAVPFTATILYGQLQVTAPVPAA